MDSDDDFTPRLGRQKARGKGRSPATSMQRILAAATLARGGTWSQARRGFSGSRIGRGAGVGRVLASRDRFAAFRQRRVVVKARIVQLKGKGFDNAKAHLRYVQRDGTTRSGECGDLYGATRDQEDRDAFLERGRGDRHQFRFIVSPEDGAEYEDLKPLTRRLMAQMEEDLGTRLDWVAVDHYNTGHPHTHIILRGKDERGADLVIARDYIRQGMRERACELVDLDLGPRDDRAIEARLRAEVEQQRFTSIDKDLIREVDEGGYVVPAGDPFQHALRTGRLRALERMGLAERDGTGWRLPGDLAENLRRLGERGDIIRTMQRAYSEQGLEPPAVLAQSIYDPAARGPEPLTARIVRRGLSDEHADHHYLVVDATDGCSHYVDIGRAENVEPLAVGAIVRITPREGGARAADRTVAEVAAANDGRYTPGAHLRHDPIATETFAQTHVRRLEAMRRALGSPERQPDGAWIIDPHHLARAEAYEALRNRDTPVVIETLSVVPLEKLVTAEAATWLDRELTGGTALSERNVSFGRDVAQAIEGRRGWLHEQGLAQTVEGVTSYAPDLLATLRRRELLRVAGQLSGELGLRFAETNRGDSIEGIYRRRVDLVSGRYALIERSRDFTLVPWRPVIERQVGKSVSGIIRESSINWTIGRERGGPTIS